MSRRQRRSRRGRVPWPYSMLSDESGQVMVVAVVALSILFLISMLIIVVGIGELRVTMLAKDSLRAFRAAEAGVSRAMGELREDSALSADDTTGAALNWPNQQAVLSNPPKPDLIAAGPPEEYNVNSQEFGDEGRYEVWLYQDPDYTAHSRKVIVAYGEVTKHGETVSRSIETKVNYTAGDANMFDAFNFLVYQGDQAGAGEGFRQTFKVENQFGSYDLDGVGPNNDGWGIYSVGPIELGSGWFGWDCNVYGNVISEDSVYINPDTWSDILTLAPLDIHGIIYAGIDGAGECKVRFNVNLAAYGDLYVGKIYASDNVSVSTWFNGGALNTSGLINVDKGIECGGDVNVDCVASGSWGGGIDIGHAGNGPEDGIKCHGKVRGFSYVLGSDIDIGDIECFEDGSHMGVNFDAGGIGFISAGDIKSTGNVDCLGVAGGINVGDIWAGTDTGTADGLSVNANAVLGGFTADDIAGHGMVNLFAAAGGFTVDNIYAGYRSVSSYWECNKCGYRSYTATAPNPCPTIEDAGPDGVLGTADDVHCPGPYTQHSDGHRMGVMLRAYLGGYTAGTIHSFSKVDSAVGIGGGGIGGINAGSEAAGGDGSTGVKLLVWLGGAGVGDINSRGKADIATWFGGAGVGNVYAGTDQAGLHGGVGIYFRTEESGCNMGNATCVGQFHAKTNLGVTTIGSITAGTDSTTLLGGKGTGGDGVRLEPFAADITTGNITSRGRVQLPYQDLTAAFGITTGTVTAGTNDTSGNGGTGVNIRTYLAAWITTGAIASRGMVNLESVVNLGTITTGGITAGTNDGSLSGGLGVHINCILASITVGGGIESTGPVKVEATGGAGVSTSGIYGGADSSSPQTNEGYGVNLYSKILSGITDTGELKSPTCIKVNAQYAATVSCNQAYAGSGGGMGLHCYTANSDLSGDVITFSGLVKARGKVKAETYGAGIRFNGGLEAGSDNGLTTGVGFQPYMRGGLTDVAHFHISNKVHLYSYGSISPDQSSTWGLSCFHPYNVHCATDINWDWGGGENLYLGGYVRTPGYVRLSWTNASDDFNYIDNPAGGFNEAWCGGYFAIKPRWTNVNLSNGVRSGTGVYVDVYGKTFAAGYVKANALSWNLDDGIYNINGDVESQAAVAWWGDDSWDARVDISGVMRSKGNISIRTADNVYVYGGLRSNGAVSLDSYDDHLTENYTYRFGEVRSKLSPAITLDDGTWRFDGQLVSQNNISLSVDCYVAGEDYFRGGIKSEGTVSIDTIGNEQFRCEMIYSKLGPNINLDDGTWILGGLTSQGSWNPNLGAWTNFDIWGGITLGGSHSVTFNDYSLGTEGSYVVQSGGKLNVVGNVNFTLPAEPDPGYGGFHIYDGINCNGNVYIDGRGLNKNDLTIDLGLKANGTGVFAGGNITVNVEDTNDRYFLRCNLKNGNGNIVTLRANNDWADDTLDVYGDIWTGTISKPTIHGGSRVYFYGTNTVPGNYVYPVLPTPAASLFDWPGDAAFSLPAAPGNPPCGVNGLHDAPAAPPAPPALPGEPAMTSFGGSYPAFPNMALASSDLPSWMSYTTEVLEGKALIPSKPSEPIWNASLPVTADRYRPDWSTLLPFGPNNRVKMPKPQWDWWRAEAEQDDIDQPATKHYWSGDATGADKVRVPSSCTDEVFFVEGNAEIDSIDWANDGSVGKATIVVYGNGATPDAGLDLGAAGNGQNGDIKVTGSPDWRIFDKKELHLIANDDISLAPTSDSNFNIGENALYGFYAGDSLEIELALFHSILGSGVLRGNLIAGNSVMLKDPANLGGVGVGWYGFEYSRPEIKPEGWMTPFETGSWRELTKANWK